MSKERRINLRFSEDVFKRLDRKRREQNTSFQAVGEELFQAWLAGGDMIPTFIPPDLTPKERALVQALVKCFSEKNNARTLRAIDALLEPESSTKRRKRKGVA